MKQLLVLLSQPQVLFDLFFNCLLQVSFGKILTPIGVVLLSYGFGSYFQLLPANSLAAIILVTGFPLTLLGFALSYAQLEPVPCRSTQGALEQRDAQNTDIQKQVGTSHCLHKHLEIHLRCDMHKLRSSMHCHWWCSWLAFAALLGIICMKCYTGLQSRQACTTKGELLLQLRSRQVACCFGDPFILYRGFGRSERM